MKRFFTLAMAFGLTIGAFAQTMVTLTVDMTNEMVSANGVHVAGNFQGWDPGATPMTDNMDGTWSYSFFSDTTATYQYKFINGNAWGSDESIPGACAYDGNRQIMVDGAMGDVTSTVCYNSCAACGMTTVRFRVDMSNEDVSPFGVHVAGSFQGWDPAGTELMDPDGDMVYESIQHFDAADMTEVEFKFINGNTWADPNEVIAGACGNASGNRVLTVDSENILLSANESGVAYCYNSCSACDGTGGGGGAEEGDITFQVDLSEYTGAYAMVNLNGSFNGWCGTCAEMTDGDGDNIYELTIEAMPAGTIEYKFTLDGWAVAEEFAGGEPCTLTTGEYVNRVYEVAGDATLDAVCWNSCSTCESFDGDTSSPPFFTHVNNVNAAGNATLYWDFFSPAGEEEFLQNEIRVFDLLANPLGDQWHIITPEFINGNLVFPTGWVMPSFLYDANEQAHCFVGIQKTEENGAVSVSDMSDFLCSIHLGISEGTTPGTVELEWNSPYALSGFEAGGPFILERKSGSDSAWDVLLEYPDSLAGGFVLDSYDYAGQELHYRIRQLAANGEDEHVSNVAGFLAGAPSIGGCTDEEAWNYSPEAEYDDGSCEYFANSCEFIGDSTWQGLELGVYPTEGLVHFVADTVFQELVVNVPALVQEPITGSSFAAMSLSNLELNGMPPGLEFDVVPDTVFASSQECISYSGQPYQPGEYEVELIGDLTVSFFGSPYVIEDFSTPFFITVEDNPDPLYGCTYSLASNYSMFAAVDDGSCVFAGCTDPEANNYEKFATEDDGSCDFTPCGLECPTDLDQDGVTTTSDLLLFLGEFGEGCEVAASVWSCGDPLEYQGYDYATVQIGEQCWFAENLRTTTFSDGSGLQYVSSNEIWAANSGPLFADYGSGQGDCWHSAVNVNMCDSAGSSDPSALDVFGYLYNFRAVEDERGLCPQSWKIPSQSDFMILADQNGSSSEGLMSMDYWFAGNSQTSEAVVGTNTTGFDGRPGGYRYHSNGLWDNGGIGGYWWTRDYLGSFGDGSGSLLYAGTFRLYYSNDEPDLGQQPLSSGLSVRCIKDSE